MISYGPIGRVQVTIHSVSASLGSANTQFTGYGVSHMVVLTSVGTPVGAKTPPTKDDSKPSSSKYTSYVSSSTYIE